MKRILKSSLTLLLLMFICSTKTVSVYAMEKGTYTVPLVISYANPETGEIADGGSNEALGNSMCESVMQDDALIEYNGEKTYVTLGFGLASNVSSIRVQVQTAAGVNEYTEIELTQTGTCERDGDECIHYRFEMADPTLLISPILYVDPMGRDVQFFIRLDLELAAEGTGNYLSEMMTEEESEPEAEEAAVEEPDAGEDQDITEDPIAAEEPDPEEESETEEGNSVMPWVIAGAAVVIIGAGTVIWRIKKKRGGM